MRWYVSSSLEYPDVQPAVNRQPGYRWGGLGQLVPRPKSKMSKKSAFWAPEILDYLTMGSLTKANQATGVGPGGCTT